MPPRPALSVSTLSSPDALSAFNAHDDALTADSPASSSSPDASLDAQDSMDVVGSSQESLLPDTLSRRSLRSRAPDSLRKRAQRHAGAHAAPRPHPGRDARVRALKCRALAIPSTGKTPATARQRMVMQMVYDEITPYPDEAWVSQLGIIIHREYHQVKNWFSNQRQKDARDSRQSPQPSASSSMESSLCKIACDGRDMRIRAAALDVCAADDWSDSFFDEVVMIHNFRLLAKHSQDEARAALPDSPLATTDLAHARPPPS